MSQSKARETRKATDGFRQRHVWKVTLADGANRVEEVEYAAYWAPEKVEQEDIGAACAAERNVFGPRDPQGNPVNPVGVVAVELVA